MDVKHKSVKVNMIMNAILTMSSFIFPLITFPYVSRILLAEGTGKVNFAKPSFRRTAPVDFLCESTSCLPEYSHHGRGDIEYRYRDGNPFAKGIKPSSGRKNFVYYRASSFDD